jgi:hypothetical protein
MRYPYAMIVTIDGQPMGDKNGIPCSSRSQAEAFAREFMSVNPRIQTEIVELKEQEQCE